MDVSQTELATLIGATRQTVNLCLREFESEGLIVRGANKLLLPSVGELRNRLTG